MPLSVLLLVYLCCFVEDWVWIRVVCSEIYVPK
jgi:hypothetical protein